MVFVALTAGQVVQTRLARASELSVPMSNRLRRAYGTQAVLGVLVIGASGWLLGLDPDKVTTEDDGVDFAINEEFVEPEAGIDLTVSLDPGRAGVVNRLRVEVREPAEGLSGLEVRLIPPVGSDEGEVIQAIPLDGAGIADSGPDAGVPLDVSGAWTLRVSASTSSGSLRGDPRSINVAEEDGSQPTSEIGSTPTLPPATPAPSPPSSTTAP
jgi:copper transport protein